MKYSRLVPALFLLAAFIAGCGSRPSGEVLVKVGSNKITQADLDLLTEINPRIAAQMASPQGRKRILDNMVEQDLLYQQAIKQGVNRDSRVKAKADLYRRVVIAQAFVDREVEHAAKKHYDENQDEFKKLGLSHIMIHFGEGVGEKDKPRSEEDALKIAEEIRAKLEEGADFEEIARERSEDRFVKSRGAGLGFVSRKDRRLVARGYGPLLDRAFEMKVGEISEPIKTSDAYHIITVTRGIEIEPFDGVKQEISLKLQNSVRNALMAKLNKDYKVEYLEEDVDKAEREAGRKRQRKRARTADEQAPTAADEGQELLPEPEGETMTEEAPEVE